MPQLANRDSHEATLAAAIAGIHEKAIQGIQGKLKNPPSEHDVDEAFWLALIASYRDASKPLLEAIYLDAVAGLGDELDSPIDLSKDAASWAANYADELARNLVGNRKQSFVKAVQKATESGWTIEQLIEYLMPSFSVVNAGSVAITETTNAISTGERAYASKYKVLFGLTLVAIVRNDFDPCDLCKDKQGKNPYLVGFPPYHPNCRDYVEYLVETLLS